MDRQQRVVINGESSNWSEVTSGVPQGSVLGPILFIVYSYDLDTDITSNISKFADDTKIRSRVDKKSGCQSLQNDLNKIITWSKTWQMNFNADKCKINHFGSRNEGLNYFIEGSILQAASEKKF